MDKEWTITAIRRQIIKVLRRLKNRYKLIDVEFHHGKDAWVIPLDLGGETFVVNRKNLPPEKLKELTKKEIMGRLRPRSQDPQKEGYEHQ